MKIKVWKRSIFVALLLILLSFLFIPTNVQATASPPVVVFYYGLFDTTFKNRMIATLPQFVVLNTPGGSYKTATPNATEIDELQAVGIKVFSYVSTGGLVGYIYDESSPQNDRTFVRGCIAAVAAEGCDGIFFDEGGVGTVKSPPDGTYTPSHADRYLEAPSIDCNGNPNSWSGYTIEDYADYAHSLGLLAVEGTDFREAQYLNQNIFGIFDYVLTDEGYPVVDGRVGGTPQGSEIGYAGQCWVIGTGLSNNVTAANYTNLALANGFAASYHTNTYGVLPSWYEAYIALVNTDVALGELANITQMTANPSDTSIILTWIRVVGSSNTTIRYSTDTYPATPTSNLSAYNDIGWQTTVTGLTAGQVYYFSAWAVTGGNYSTNAFHLAMSTLATSIPSGGADPNNVVLPTANLPADMNQTPSPAGFQLEPFTSIVNYFVTSEGGLGMPVSNAWEMLAILGIVVSGFGTYVKIRNFFVAFAVVFMVTMFMFGIHLVQGWLLGIEIVIGAGVWAVEHYLQ